MPDSSWDNGAAAAPAKRLSFWGKLAIGCGTALLCFVLAVGSLVWWGMNRTSRLMDEAWAELHQDVESLGSEAGSRALYRANPGLADEYPTEEAFLTAAAEWRPRLAGLPAKRPDFKELFDGRHGGGFSFRTHRSDGHKVVWMRLRLPSGANLVVEREGGKLTDIQVD